MNKCGDEEKSESNRTNCWEYLSCGREPGGSNADEMGVCPVTTFEAADGFLGGRNGGRACVYITGTFCCQVLKGTQRDNKKPCIDCGFYKLLRRENGENMSLGNFMEYIRSQAPGCETVSGIVLPQHDSMVGARSRSSKFKK